MKERKKKIYCKRKKNEINKYTVKERKMKKNTL